MASENTERDAEVFSLAGVTKRYGARAVLEDVSLAARPGEIVAVIGPSGSGKSTLLRVLTGLVAPDAGAVTFAGAAVTPQSAPGLRRKLGFVVQGGGLFPHLTAFENIAVMARHLRWESQRTTARIDALVQLTRLPGDVLGRYPSQLSGGQRQRVALMRALMLDPAVLLLDEPFGALDPITRFELQEELQQVFRTLGKTVLLVTHDLTEAAFFSHRLVLMSEGRIVQQGSLEALRSHPASPLVTRFIAAHRALPAERP